MPTIPSKIIALTSAVLFSVGCSSLVKTTKFDKSNPPSGSHKPDGISYYLPKRLVKVVVDRKVVPSDRVKETAKAAEEAKEKSKKAADLAAAAKAASSLAAKVAEKATGAGKEEADKLASLRKAEMEVAEATSADAKKKADEAAAAAEAAFGEDEAMQQAISDREHAQSLQDKATIARLEADLAQQKAKQTPDASTQAQGLAAAARKAEEAATKARREAEKSLLEVGRIASGKGEKKYEDNITVSELPLVADTSVLFVADLNHWPQHDDKLTLTTTESGLLKTAMGEKSDKTGQIIQDTAKLAKELVKIFTIFEMNISSKIPEPGEQTLPPCPEFPNIPDHYENIRITPFSIEFVIDPTNSSEMTLLNRQLCRLATKFIVLVNGDNFLGKTDQLPNLFTENSKQIGGLLYRRPIPYTLEIRERQLSKLPVLKWPDDEDENMREKQREISSSKKSVQVMLPNKSPITAVSMKTGWLITTKYDVGFQDGMLTKLDVQHPSEIYSLIQIPINIAKDIMSIPSEILQLKFDYSSKDTALLDAQKKNIEAQDALKKKIEEIQGAGSASNGTTQ